MYLLFNFILPTPVSSIERKKSISLEPCAGFAMDSGNVSMCLCQYRLMLLMLLLWRIANFKWHTQSNMLFCAAIYVTIAGMILLG